MRENLGIQNKENRGCREQTIIRRLGNTNYRIKIIFAKDGCSMEDRLIHLIQYHGGNTAFSFAQGENCDILSSSQMSRRSERSA